MTTTPPPAVTTSAPPPDLDEGPTTARSLWRSRSYLVWLVSDTGQALGASLQFFLIPLLVVLVTGNAAAAGTVAAVGLTGRLATTLVGGVLADRHDLRSSWSSVEWLRPSSWAASSQWSSWTRAWSLSAR